MSTIVSKSKSKTSALYRLPRNYFSFHDKVSSCYMSVNIYFSHHICILMSTLHFSDDCRLLEFMPDYDYDGKRLKSHVIHTADVIVEGSCRTLCYMEPNCVSYNFLKTKANHKGRQRCELNDATHEGAKHDKLVNEKDFVYRGAKVIEFWSYSSVRISAEFS